MIIFIYLFLNNFFYPQIVRLHYSTVDATGYFRLMRTELFPKASASNKKPVWPSCEHRLKSVPFSIKISESSE